MSLICLSYSHQHVPIAFRERVHFDQDALANACARFRCGSDQPSWLLEFMVLSTCNRTEVYAFTNLEQELDFSAVKNELLSFVSAARGIAVTELSENARWYLGTESAKHLCRVTCGLESLVLGEPQILGQVGDALRMGLIMNSAGTVLQQLFQTAIKSGRRARHETGIAQNSLNVSTVAVNTAQKCLGSLENKTVVVLGAGEMADLAIHQLRQLGVSELLVVNRTLEAGKQLAEKHGGEAFVFEQMPHILPKADVLISSTGAPHTLIEKKMVQMAMDVRGGKPMFILDIAVPRDVAADVQEIENVERCDIDDLHMVTGQSAQLRENEIPQVESLIEQELDGFLRWLRSIGVESIISDLRKKTDEIRDQELKRLKKLLPELSSEQLEIISRFSNSLTKKILHDPTVQLRELHGTREGIGHADAVRDLFKLTIEPANEPANEQAATAPESGTSAFKEGPDSARLLNSTEVLADQKRFAD